MNEIKKLISNIMFSTGASLVILAVFLLFAEMEINYAHAVLQIFAANIVINVGLFLRWKIEIRYIFLEYLINVSYIIVVLVAFGAMLNWFSVVPIWLLVVMAIVIYALAAIISITKSRKDTEEINELLQKRKKSGEL